MLCETAREYLDALSDGEQLKTQRQLALTLRHWLTCKDCRTYRRRINQLTRTARRLPASLPAGLRERVLSQLRPTVPTYAGPHTNLARQREIAMLKKLSSITGAILLAAIAATITAKRTPHETVRYQASIPVNEAQERRRDTDDRLKLTRQIVTLQQRYMVLHDGVSLAAIKANDAKAKRLRDALHDWAIRHQNELRQMLHTNGTDKMALMQVYDALPSTLIEVSYGMPASLASDDQRLRIQALTPHDPHFNWQVASNVKGKSYMLPPNVLVDFAECHDIKVSSSTNNDLQQYTLWASGRITVTTMLDYSRPGTDKRIANNHVFERSNGAVLRTDGIHTDYIICPPYDELTR